MRAPSRAMRLLKRVGWWLRGRLDGHRVRWGVEEDIRTHIELDAERLRGEGMSPSEAMREAERRFGDRDRVRADMLRIASGPLRGVGGVSLGGAWTHVRHATRGLRATPGPTAMVVATLSAAVGVTTLMLTLSRTVLLGAGGVADPTDVVSIYGFYPALPDGMQEQPMHGTFVPLLANVDGVESLAAFKAGYFNLTRHGEPRRLDGLLTTPGLFDVAGVRPLFGPGFDDVRTGEEPVVVISWSLWSEAFGADPAVIGSNLVLNAEPYQVVGVMPRDFEFPRGEDVPPSFRFPGRPQVWVPFVPPTTGPAELGMVARLQPGLTATGLQPRLTSVVDALAEGYGRQMSFSFRAVELREQAVGRVRPALLMLLVAMGLVMAIAMANVTGVGVARSEGRLRELAVRSALGAGRRGVAAYLAAEAAVLGVVAAGGSIAIASALAILVRSAAPEGVPGIDLVHVGWRAAVLALALSMAGAACLALAPAFRMLGWRLSDTLRAVRSVGGRGARRTGAAIVALELAVTMVLLAGSLLLTRTVLNLLSVDPGFDPNGVLTAEITLPEAAYPDVARAGSVQGARMPPEAAVPRFQRRMVERLDAQPGIEAAAFANPLPFSGGQEASVFWIDGMAPTEEPPFTEYTVVSEGYFRAMGIPVLQGRVFDGGEAHDSEPVAIVSESLAARFPAGQVVGGRIKLGGRPDAGYPWLRVVGVVGDVKRADLTSAGRPEMYVHVSQGGYTVQSTSRLVVRTAAGRDPMALVGRVRSVLHDVDPELPLNRVAPMADLVASAAERARFTAAVTAAFSALALLITGLGLYSVVSFGVSTRRRELAVRAALGASGPDVVAAVMSETVRALVVGLIVGLGATALAARVLGVFLFGVAPLSPGALLAAAATLCATVALAAQGPVRASLRTDPARVLSQD